MKLTVVRRLAVVVEEEAALTKFAAAVIAWMMNAALKAAIPPIRSEHHACIHVHRVSHYWSPIGHHVCTYILELTSSTLYPILYIYMNIYSMIRSASRTNARINTARMLENASMAIKTIGRRLLTGSATLSGRTGCVAAIYLYSRNFREKSNERRGVPMRAAPV